MIAVFLREIPGAVTTIPKNMKRDRFIHGNFVQKKNSMGRIMSYPVVL